MLLGGGESDCNRAVCVMDTHVLFLLFLLLFASTLPLFLSTTHHHQHAIFSSTRVGKTTSVPIVLRNGGTVPVSVYFSMDTHAVFSMEGKGRTINLRPKASERLMVRLFCLFFVFLFVWPYL